MRYLLFPRDSAVIQLMRKYWYLLISALLFAGGLIYFGLFCDIDYQEILKEYGYHIVLVWTFLEGKTIVIVTGMLAYSLDLNPWIIALCAFIGSFLIDQIMFFLGRKKGHVLMNRFPRLEAGINKTTVLFKKYDIALILGFRFVSGMRNITPIMLGASGVGNKKFLLLNIIGAAVWAIVYTFGGVYSGRAFMHLMTQIGYSAFYVFIGFATLLFAWICFRRRFKAVRQNYL